MNTSEVCLPGGFFFPASTLCQIIRNRFSFPVCSIYQNLVETAIHTVKPENIATFLGRKLDGRYKGEMGNNYQIRLEGSRIKHMMGSVSIKMYDKYQQILRIETTANDIRFFKHYRKVDKKDGTTPIKLASKWQDLKG